MNEFLDKFFALPRGTSFGGLGTARYVATISASDDGRRYKFYAEELGGSEHISFNLYRLDSGPPLLKPCEMPEEKVIDFVLNYHPDPEVGTAT